MEQNDILQQEPQTEALPDGSEGLRVNGYVAYLNLDWLDMMFADAGWQGDYERQQKFIEETQQRLADVILKREGKPGVMMAYSWYDKDGSLRRAIEVMPVAASSKGLKIVTPDVTGYQQLRDKLAEVEAENYRLRTQMRDIGESLKANGLITERAFRATFDREPGGLVEQFEKDKEKEQIPAGLGPVKYIAIAGSIGIVRKNVDGQFVDCIEIKYPGEDDSDEVKGELNRIVICHADDILNTAGGDEQRRATEEKIHRKWMDAHGSWWRDSHTKVVIERGLSDKAKVKFEVHFLY